MGRGRPEARAAGTAVRGRSPRFATYCGRSCLAAALPVSAERRGAPAPLQKPLRPLFERFRMRLWPWPGPPHVVPQGVDASAFAGGPPAVGVAQVTPHGSTVRFISIRLYFGTARSASISGTTRILISNASYSLALADS